MDKSNLWSQDSAHILVGREGLVNMKGQEVDIRGASK